VPKSGKTLNSTLKTVAISTHKIYGCDTETYREERGRGLKSIQIYGLEESHYFTVDNWNLSDDEIRRNIASQFFNWLMDSNDDITIAFFNMNFDVSQFLKYMVSELGLEFWNEALFIPKGCIQILESERQLYLVQIRTFKGRLIRMVDIANFLVGVTLNKACQSWLGKEKVDIKSKQFLKAPATPIEQKYAMVDAQLTYELYNELVKNEVIEGQKTVTIAGRTLRHFKQFIKSNFGLSFEEYFYEGASPDEITQIQNMFEDEIRCGVRGAITEAYQRGVFYDCVHYDARSMYPTQCVRDFIPIG